MINRYALILILSSLLFSCGQEENKVLGTGIFTATSIQISAQNPGEILLFPAKEGDALEKGDLIAQIDSTHLSLQKLGLMSQKEALQSQLPNSAQMLASLLTQIDGAQKNYDRIKALYEQNAATDSQMDQASTQLSVLKDQYVAQKTVLSDKNSSLINQIQAIQEQISLLDYQITNAQIRAPFDGRILLKTAERFEYVFPGKPLVELADLRLVELKAYVVADKLSNLKIGETVKVYAEMGSEEQSFFKGKISWISDQAEFTPKTIQSQDERAGLVYAVKIQVPNSEELIKIGMYGGFQID